MILRHQTTNENLPPRRSPLQGRTSAVSDKFIVNLLCGFRVTGPNSLGIKFLSQQSSTGLGRFHCKLSTGVVWRAAVDSLGYSCKAESRPCGLALLVVHHTKTLCVPV